MSDDPIAWLIREAGPRPGVSPERTERVKHAVHEHWRAQLHARASRRRLSWALVPVAAAAATAWILSSAPRSLDTGRPAVVDVIQGSVSIDGAPAEAGNSVSSRSWLATKERSRIALRLASGASLRLDERTKLTFLSSNRLALEEGAVYVDSAPGTPPVIIQTPLGEARDVGTRFEVRLLEDAMLVRVRDGAVRVAGARERLDALRGEEVEIGRQGGLSRRTILPHAREWDWVLGVAPPFVLEDSSFGSFLEWVTREMGLRVRFETDALAEEASAIRLEGSIEGLSPREALDVVVPTTGLVFRIDQGTIFVEDRS